MKFYYFDNAATTRLDNDVLKEMLPYSNVIYGNASSSYKLGKNSKHAIEHSRQKVANILGAKPSEIYFTSGGTESDNTALKGIAHANRIRGNHIITSSIEHPAILESAKELEKEGFRITYLPVNNLGVINLEQLENAITSSTILISIMFANNEIGTIQPIKEIGRIAKKYDIPFHTDAVQAIGNLRINVDEFGIDALSMSAHKFYGPKGIGALYVRKTVDFDRFMSGGHQERNMRAGTENIAGIVGLGTAIDLAYKNIDAHNKKIKYLRDYFLTNITREFPDLKINGNMEYRLPGNANISFRNVQGSKLLKALDDASICVSAGSACSAGLTKLSHVLEAIGMPEEYSHNSLRVTIGKNNTKEEVDFLIYSLRRILKS
ncbi:MAG: cysteine desulfurase [Clostridia bacterium]|nr:cysteine desulfurase [Clostridia bacterium]